MAVLLGLEALGLFFGAVFEILEFSAWDSEGEGAESEIGAEVGADAASEVGVGLGSVL